MFRIHWQHLPLEIVSVSSASGTWCRRACGEHRAVRCASASRNEPQGEDAGEPKHHWRGSRRSWMKLSRNSPGSRRLRGRRGLTGSDSPARRTAPILRHPPPPEYAWSTPAPYCATCSIQLPSACVHPGQRIHVEGRVDRRERRGVSSHATASHRWTRRASMV